MKGINELMDKENQHYIPQFYFRNFSNREGISMHYIPKDKYIENAPIDKECSDKYFYSKNLKYENNLEKIEGFASGVIRDIINTNELWNHNSEDKGTLLMFILLQIYRTEIAATELNRYANEVGRGMLYNEKFSGNLDIEYNEIENIEFGFSEPGVEMIKFALKNMYLLYDMDYSLLINQTDIQFVFGESPAIKYNKYFIDIGKNTVGIACKGLIILLPISPNLTVVFYDSKLYSTDKDEKHRIYIKDSKCINELNILQYLNTKNKLYGRNTEVLKKFKDMNDFEVLNNFKPEFITKIIGQADDNNAYVAIIYPQINYHVNLDYLVPIGEKVDYGDGVRNRILVYINELMDQLERTSDKDFRIIFKGFGSAIELINRSYNNVVLLKKTLMLLAIEIFKELNCNGTEQIDIIYNTLVKLYK